MKIKYLTIMILSLAIVLLPLSAIGESVNSEPEVVPHDIETKAGEIFILKLSVEAKVESPYNLSFSPRSWFSFPEGNKLKIDMLKDDATVFEVQCQADNSTPDGNYNITFKLTWVYNGTTEEYNGALRVEVGEGAETEDKKEEDDACQSAFIIGAVCCLAFLALVVKRRRNN